MKRQFMIEKLYAHTASLVYALLLLTPIAVLILNARGISFEEVSYITSHYSILAVRTVSLALLVSLFSLIISLALLYSCLKLNNALARYVIPLIMLPLIFPPYIGAIMYRNIFKSPFVLSIWSSSTSAEFIQAIFVLALFLYPYLFLTVYTRFIMINPSHRKILALHKFSLRDKIRIYYFPHLKHAAFNGLALIFLYVIADFGAVSILRIDTITTEIYRKMILQSGIKEASVVSLVFFLFTFLFILSGQYKIGRIVSSSVKPLVKQPQFSSVARHAVFSIFIIAVVFVFSIAVPFYKIISWLYVYMTDSSSFKQVWTTAKYSLAEVSVNSVSIALFITGMAILFSFIYCLIKMHALHTRYSFVIRFSIVLHALPGITIAFSVFVLKQLIGMGYATEWLFLVYGYIARFIGIAFALMEPAFRSIPRSARFIGALFLPGKVEYIRAIVMPHTKNHLIHAANFVYFNSIRDLTIPLFLMPLGFEVLPLRIWQTANEGLYIYAAPSIAALLLVSLPSLFLYVKNQL